MKSRKELKEQAKTALRGNWPWGIGVFFVPLLVMELAFWALFAVLYLVFREVSDVDFGQSNSVVLIFVTMAFLMLGLLAFFAIIGIGAGVSYAYLDLIRGRKWSFKQAGTYAFKHQRFDSIFGVALMAYIFHLLWSLLLVIPGYIKAIAYSQSLFILKDDFDRQNGITTTSAITKSRLMMEGYKKDYFLLLLSFLGWHVLSVATGGLGYLFLIPYLGTTLAAFYEDLRQQEQPKELEELEDKLAQEKEAFEKSNREYQAKLLERKEDKQKAHDEKMAKKLKAQREREEKRREKVAKKRKEREAKKPKKSAKKDDKKSSSKEKADAKKVEAKTSKKDSTVKTSKAGEKADKAEKTAKPAAPKAHPTSKKSKGKKASKNKKKKAKKRK